MRRISLPRIQRKNIRRNDEIQARNDGLGTQIFVLYAQKQKSTRHGAPAI
jgi:hypothetical protein